MSVVTKSSDSAPMPVTTTVITRDTSGTTDLSTATVTRVVASRSLAYRWPSTARETAVRATTYSRAPMSSTPAIVGPWPSARMPAARAIEAARIAHGAQAGSRRIRFSAEVATVVISVRSGELGAAGDDPAR